MLGTANGRSILVYKTLNYQNKTCPAIRYVCNNIPQKKTTPLANLTILLRLEVIIRSYLQSKLISGFTLKQGHIVVIMISGLAKKFKLEAQFVTKCH